MASEQLPQIEEKPVARCDKLRGPVCDDGNFAAQVSRARARPVGGLAVLVLPWHPVGMRDFTTGERHELALKSRLNEADPIWGEVAVIYDTFYGSNRICRSERSGCFAAPPGLREYIASWSPEAKARLTTWVTDQNRSGNSFPEITIELLGAIYEGRPLRFSAKVDRLFAYLETRGYRLGDPIIPHSPAETADTLEIKNALMRWVEAINAKELFGFLNTLRDEGLLSDDGYGGYRPSGKGMARLDSISERGPNSDQAFVALWFATEMNEAFDQGIVPALAEAGYRAFRIDRKEHANKIDDEIIAEIRRSRFVVADFTCEVVMHDGVSVSIPRGGVYYEAGFAQGLGIPVIWTVRADQIGLVHFDTRQFNHITWTSADDLRVKLFRRVAATVGYYRGNQSAVGQGGGVAEA